jgi:branched-chain amino acid aminotransferase
MSPVGAYYGKTLSPVKICIETKYLRAAPGGLGDTKAGANYAASIKAAEEAKKKGFNQVLWLDHEKKNIEEVGTMNVFFVLGDEIVTPRLSGSILEGKIRNSAISLLKDEGYKVSERTLSLEEVKKAADSGDLKEVFGTGTAAVISPVGEFGNEDLQITINNNEVGEITSWLHKKLTSIQYGRAKDPYSWVHSLSN